VASCKRLLFFAASPRQNGSKSGSLSDNGHYRW
jgi:hypothetical protein